MDETKRAAVPRRRILAELNLQHWWASNATYDLHWEKNQKHFLWNIGFPNTFAAYFAAQDPAAPLCWGFGKLCASPKLAHALQDQALDCI